jgi:MFS family permease
MVNRLRSAYQNYPKQFWLMFFGMLISTVGGSMIWPYLMIYVSETLDAPLTLATGLMTLNSAFGLISSFLVGPVVDRFGRKWVMVISLLTNGITYLFMSHASELPAFAVLMALIGMANPLYRMSGDAMVADLIPPPKRPEAYALLRMSNNVGVALGPAIGGFLAATSYSLAFYMAALGMAFYGLLLAFFAVETLPKFDPEEKSEKHPNEKFGGYLKILQDRPFITFVLGYTLVIMCATLVWVVLPIYAKENYGIPENIYGFIPTTNALMVVTLQVAVTQVTKRFATLPVLTVGAIFYMLAVGGMSLGTGFWGFWIFMVVLTIGELILVPTASTYVANLAPPDKRGRYMGIFGLCWRIALGVGPFLGGVLNDNLGPKAIWYGGFLIGLLSVITFLVMNRGRKAREIMEDEVPVAGDKWT